MFLHFACRPTLNLFTSHAAMRRISLICFVIFLQAASLKGMMSGMKRLREHEMSACLRRIPCLTTLERMPVCLSDGRTYANTGVIKCLNLCLPPEERVHIDYFGYCVHDIHAMEKDGISY